MYYVAFVYGVYGSPERDGILEGPYPTLDAADRVVQSVQGSVSYVADESGRVHPDVDQQVREELEEELASPGPYPPALDRRPV